MAYLAHLSLTNFRNLVQLDLELPPGVLVFFGANAQGKTALLEAVYLLAIARSFRAENEREVVNFRAALEGQQALVGGTVQKRDERLTVYVGYQPVPHRGSFSGSSAPEQTGGVRLIEYLDMGRYCGVDYNPDFLRAANWVI